MRVCVAVLSLLIAACSGSAPEPTPAAAPAQSAPAAAAPASGDGHAHTAPHGGGLTELGDHFGFLELVVDAAAGTATLYVLDGGAEKAVRVTHPTLSLTVTEPAAVGATPLVLTAVASSLTGETVGDASQFAVTHEALKGAAAVKARLATIAVKGQTFNDVALAWPDDHED